MLAIVSGFWKNASRKSKLAVIAAVLLAVFLVGRQLLAGKTGGYILGRVQKQTVTEIVSESGMVTTSNRVDIYSPTNGVIDKVFVQNGDSIRQGQILFSVISTASDLEKAAALASYQAANSALSQAENTRRSTQTTVDRVHDDLKNKDTSETFTEKETRTIAEVANDNAYDALVAARVQLVSAQTAYQATRNSVVKASSAGTVSNISVVAGSGVKIYNVLSPQTPVAVIASGTPAEVVISVGETDVNKIEVGQEASIKLDAAAGKIYTGKVVRFDQLGTFIQGVVKFNVYLDIENPDELVKSGSTADVEIITKKFDSVLAVPNTAVKPYQKGKAVRKLDANGKLVFLPVKTGIRGKEFTQITDGLSEGQKIVLSLTSETVQKKGLFGL